VRRSSGLGGLVLNGDSRNVAWYSNMSSHAGRGRYFPRPVSALSSYAEYMEAANLNPIGDSMTCSEEVIALIVASILVMRVKWNNG